MLTHYQIPVRIGFVLLVLPLLLAGGCDNGQVATYPVKGTIEFSDGGHPMFGDIEFFNEANQLNARGILQRDGSFSVGTYDLDDGAVAGIHKVVIIQRTRNHMLAYVKHEIKHDHGDMIDPKYYDYRSSALTTEVLAVEQNDLKLIVERASKEKQEDAD